MATRTPRTPEIDARTGLEKLATYPFHILSWVGGDGYPVSVAVEATIEASRGRATFAAPAGLDLPSDRELSLTGSHIRPQPGYGYDERRHVTVWGRSTVGPDGRIELAATDAWGWDEAEVPFFEYSERSTAQSRKYFDALSRERGTPVRPKLSLGFLALRTTRLPFLTATIVPVVLGILIAGFVVGLGYTAPPLKPVYRGLGEIAVAVGFGPLMLLGAYVVQTGGAVSWEPFVASIPIALLIALVLYVNEIPDRRGDARAGKRTLPVRFSSETIVAGYRLAILGAYAALVAGVIAGLLPIPALLMLLTVPLALQVERGLRPNYDNPYGLMAVMGVNIRLHLYAGLLLVAAYVLVLIAQAVAPGVPLFLGRQA
jgi:1,4-dihydroxy-2-naphthoate octaprenyltransferase